MGRLFLIVVALGLGCTAEAYKSLKEERDAWYRAQLPATEEELEALYDNHGAINDIQEIDFSESLSRHPIVHPGKPGGAPEVGEGKIHTQSIPKAEVDLSLEPKQRWAALVRSTVAKHGWEYTFADVRRYWEYGIPKKHKLIVMSAARIAEAKLDKELLEELRGATEVINSVTPKGYKTVTFIEELAINLIYEFSAGCTSIVTKDRFGTILHARNLDWPLPANVHFNNLTYIMDFVHKDRVLWSGIHNVGFIGVATAVRHYGWSVTQDERFLPNFTQTLLDNLYHLDVDGAQPVTWEMRRAMRHKTGYKGAVANFTGTTVAAAEYYIVGGVVENEGAVITREWNKTLNVWSIPNGPKPTYVLETNYDHWVQPPKHDDRRALAEAAMNKIPKVEMDRYALFSVMATPGNNVTRGVLNSRTLYTVVMGAATQLIEGWLYT